MKFFRKPPEPVLRLDWKSLLSLRTVVLGAVLMVWNGGLIAAMKMGGGIPHGMFSTEGRPVVVATCLVAAAFGVIVGASSRVRTPLLDPERGASFRAFDFYVFAGVMAFVAMGLVLFGLLRSLPG